MNNKVIVVTGGSGLIGKELIRYLKQKGSVVVNGDLAGDDKASDFLQLDITREESVVAFIEKVAARYGHIDGWVNNAYPRTPDWNTKMEDVPFESWRKNIDMHLNGYYICARHVLEHMIKLRKGSLVNMASIYGMVGPDFSIYEGTTMTMPAAYAAIKGGVINLTRYLASYAGTHHVRVNSVSPGGIQDGQAQSFVDHYKSKVPLRRMGKPEDVAPGVSFLLSDEASYITGHNLVIDGGWTAI